VAGEHPVYLPVLIVTHRAGGLLVGSYKSKTYLTFSEGFVIILFSHVKWGILSIPLKDLCKEKEVRPPQEEWNGVNYAPTKLKP
jgi:hypothetical protein